MTQVNIFLTSFKTPLEQDVFSDYLSLLPPDLKEKNSRYIRWQDRHSHLLGKLLLIEALKPAGVGTGLWNFLKYNSHHRPCLTLDEYDFNTSHSGGFVICAIGKKIRLGIDIEENRNVNVENFRNVMTPGQWQDINAANYPLKEFYKYWTIKESVIKADGRGFSIPINKLEVKDNTVQYEDKLWFVRELAVNTGYSAALATDQLSTYKIHYVNFHRSHLKS